MKLFCALEDHKFPKADGVLEVVLYGSANGTGRGSAGGTARHLVLKKKLQPAGRAWDFLSMALSVTAADWAGHRNGSADGWTREFELTVAVADSTFWTTQRALIEKLLGFLTNDRWKVEFVADGFAPAPVKDPFKPAEDCVSLLSGGLDSFIGNIDLAASGKKPYVVSNTVRGDADNQRAFARRIGEGLSHLQLNHNVEVPNPENPPSQRARSIIFLAYGILAATTLERYQAGKVVTLYVCENGFISINPALTPARIGSLSTRTTHPEFLRQVQQLLDNAGLRVRIENPYQFKTKGEMLSECQDQKLLRSHAAESTSCGRYKQYGYKHCGRCVPCLVRRAAFRKWGVKDTTVYVYADLGRDDPDYAGFDDVRSVAMALAAVKSDGLDRWIGTSLNAAVLGDVSKYRQTIARGLDELGSLLKHHGVK